MEAAMAGKKQLKREAAQKRRKQRQVRQIGIGMGILLLVAAVFAWTMRSQDEPLSDAEIAELPISPSVGAMAPDFALQDVRGQPVALSDYRGKPVAMMFFHTW
jgi:cytochrome oxidase Cu insertion factor (SCO1/SenC/PrrC family)